MSSPKVYIDENGLGHREDGPAYICNDDEEWWCHGKLHRVGGPACSYSTGAKYWYQYGKRHRLDGPAAEYGDGERHWYYKGKYITNISQEVFEKQIKLKAFW